MITNFVIAFLVLLLALAAMAVGIIFGKNKKKGELKGSCGGPEFNPDCCLKKNRRCNSNDRENNQ